jgi:predicted transcriptional regulator
MTEDSKAQKVTFHCSKELADRLDKIAEKGDIPRSKLVCNMVEILVSYCEFTNKVGIFQLGVLLRDAGRMLDKTAKKWRETNSVKGIVA